MTEDRQEMADLQARLAQLETTIRQRTLEDAAARLNLRVDADRANARAEQAEAALADWRSMSAADKTGHLLRCARVRRGTEEAKWSCADGCPEAALARLREAVLSMVEHAEIVDVNAKPWRITIPEREWTTMVLLARGVKDGSEDVAGGPAAPRAEGGG